MFQFTRIVTFATGRQQRVATLFQTVRSQPGWATRLALLAFVIVIGLPIMLLVLAATLVAAVVFGGALVIQLLLNRVRGVLPRNDGRQNVRVIQRIE